MARQGCEDAATTRLAALGTSFLRHPPEGFCPTTLFEPTGGFLLSCADADPRLEEIRRHCLAGGVHTYFATRSEVLEKLPELRESPFRTGLFCPFDGLVDIHALLGAYLASAEVVTGARVTGFERGGKRIVLVKTEQETYRADWVVNAAGAWAKEVGEMAGAGPAPLTPKRRHLLHTGPLEGQDPHQPYAWCLHPAVYFRPESHGLLLSACDELAFPPCAPPVDPDITLLLAERLAGAFPHLIDLPIRRTWAELRTFSSDGGFVIGRDPAISNMLWVAGLGGHGMTSSAAVGELAASLLLGQVPPLDPAPYAPARFA